MKWLNWLFMFFPFVALFVDDPAGGGGNGQPGVSDGGSQNLSDDALKAAGIEKQEDGSLRLLANPNDPHSTVYVGKNFPELMNNVKSGITEKDRVISESRKPDEVIDQPGEVEVPDEAQLRTSLSQKYGVEEVMFGWKPADWKQYEIDNGAAMAQRMMNRVDYIQNTVSTQVTQAKDMNEVTKTNVATYDRVTEAVSDLLKNFGIAESDYDATYEEICDKELQNPANYSNGILVESRLLAAATKGMRTFLTKTEQTRLQQELEKQRQNRQSAASPGSPASPLNTDLKEAPKSYEDARAQALAELRSKG